MLKFLLNKFNVFILVSRIKYKPGKNSLLEKQGKDSAKSQFVENGNNWLCTNNGKIICGR